MLENLEELVLLFILIFCAHNTYDMTNYLKNSQNKNIDYILFGFE